jgi:endonuclease/exonuclease/phosphatase family metal-dependent hydrolase
MKLRIMTWNIHGAVGPDRRHDLDRVVKVIKAHDPDILALQEIDARGKKSAQGMPMDYLACALRPHVAEARTVLAPDGHYGHALISRWPLSNVVLHDISHGRWERRHAIEAEVQTPCGLVHVAAVHLGLWFGERQYQAAKLARIANSNKPVSIMMGDFNDWTWRGPVGRALATALPGCALHRTFPARWPLFRLDRIYCRPSEALVSSSIDLDSRVASDHLAVVAEIKLGET